MKRLWTREETIVALYVYCIVPFTLTNKNNPTIIEYAKKLNRTPSSLGMKIGNIGRLDPELKKQSISGLSNGAKLEEVVWNEFNGDRENLVLTAEKILADLSNRSIEDKYLEDYEKDYTGDEKERLVKTRVNQDFFRSAVLSAYNGKCAITGVDINDFLIASHIVPWSEDKSIRLDPKNGICLNSIHDRAFDRGFITIDNDYRVVVSNKLKEVYSNEFIDRVFKSYEGTKISLPDKFIPSKDYLQYHQDKIFLG